MRKTSGSPPLQTERQLQKLARRARRHQPRLGNERLKPAITVRADPPIRRSATDPDEPPVRAHVLTSDERADQPPALRLRQTRLSRIRINAYLNRPISRRRSLSTLASDPTLDNHERRTLSARLAHE